MDSKGLSFPDNFMDIFGFKRVEEKELPLVITQKEMMQTVAKDFCGESNIVFAGGKKWVDGKETIERK